MDGNKRAAVAVTAAFLRVNGYRLMVDDQDAYQFLIGLFEAEAFRYERLEPWLRQHAVR